jgi:hypothetical protein
MIIHIVSYISYASSEDHYILREIMLRRTKGINL